MLYAQPSIKLKDLWTKLNRESETLIVYTIISHLFRLRRKRMVSFPSEVMSLILSFNDTSVRRCAGITISLWFRDQRQEYRRLGWKEISICPYYHREYNLRIPSYFHREYNLRQYGRPTFLRPLSIEATNRSLDPESSGPRLDGDLWHHYWSLLKDRALTNQDTGQVV